MHFQLLLTILAALPQCQASGDTSALTYCATENTGSSFDVVSDTYQSNGACEKTCAKYGLAIMQYKDCWCSNVAPASGTQKNVTECSASCPGYPSDACGSASKGVYAYIAVDASSVTSTAGGSSSTSGTTTSSSTTLSSSITSSSTGSDSTTSEHVAVTTSSNGEVKTVTIAASGATSTGGSSSSGHSSSGLSGGSIAGIVVGVLGGLALVGALIFLVFFYRKRARSASPVPSQDMADRTSQGSNYSRGVFPGGAGGSSLNRKGTFTDNRMNPNVVYPNGRRDSSVSLQDNEDYSRPVLRVTNAD